jgi:hypothetical protein
VPMSGRAHRVMLVIPQRPRESGLHHAGDPSGRADERVRKTLGLYLLAAMSRWLLRVARCYIIRPYFPDDAEVVIGFAAISCGNARVYDLVGSSRDEVSDRAH